MNAAESTPPDENVDSYRENKMCGVEGISRGIPCQRPRNTVAKEHLRSVQQAVFAQSSAMYRWRMAMYLLTTAVVLPAIEHRFAQTGA